MNNVFKLFYTTIFCDLKAAFFVTHFYFLSLISSFAILHTILCDLKAAFFRHSFLFFVTHFFVCHIAPYFAFEIANEVGQGICIVQRIYQRVTPSLYIQSIELLLLQSILFNRLYIERKVIYHRPYCRPYCRPYHRPYHRPYCRPYCIPYHRPYCILFCNTFLKCVMYLIYTINTLIMKANSKFYL